AATCPLIVARDCPADVGRGIGLADALACAASLARASCEDVLNGASSGCAPLAGSVAAGDPGRTNEQCGSGVCRFDGDPCGSCAAPLDEGEPCADVAGVCGRGLACDVGGTNSCQTQQLRQANEVCDWNVLRCASGLFCA